MATQWRFIRGPKTRITKDVMFYYTVAGNRIKRLKSYQFHDLLNLSNWKILRVVSNLM